MKLNNLNDLKSCLSKDALNYQSQQGYKKYWNNICSNPTSDQKYIWKYIKCLRYSEYYLQKKGIINKFKKIIYLYRLRRLSYKTGFQIPPFTCSEGLTIWHYGAIIINGAARIGKNAVLNPGIVIGHKTPNTPSPIISDNVFIGAGVKIIGSIKIGNNVTIAPNAVVVSDVRDNCIVGGVPAQIIKEKKTE